jgi:hypothetical protein
MAPNLNLRSPRLSGVWAARRFSRAAGSASRVFSICWSFTRTLSAAPARSQRSGQFCWDGVEQAVSFLAVECQCLTVLTMRLIRRLISTSYIR